jgi:hypothetical protein
VETSHLIIWFTAACALIVAGLFALPYMEVEFTRYGSRRVKYVLLAILVVAFAWIMLSPGAEDRVRQVCSAATYGKRYSDFEEVIANSYGERKRPLSSEKGSNGEDIYLYLYLHWPYAADGCEIYVKDGIITGKKSIRIRDEAPSQERP